MSRSTNKRIESQGSLTDRSKAKSTDKELRGLTYTREIVITTDEPDIPQITILKVQRLQPSTVSIGFQQIIKLFQRVRLKRLFKGFSQMCSLNQAAKIKLINCAKFVNIVKNRQKNQMKSAWVKLLNLNSKFQSKLNTSRLLSKLSSALVNKAKLNGFNALKEFGFSRLKRSTTQISQSTTKKVDEKLQLQLTRLRSQQFSQKFMTLCKRFVKYTNKKFIEATILELQPNIQKELERYKQFRNGQGQPVNNQTILIVLNNHIFAIKDLKKDLDENKTILKDLQKKDLENKMNFYLDVEKEFEKADTQIRVSFEKQNKIQQRELSRIIQNQLLHWNKLKQHPIYASRLFISALIAKLIKDGMNRLNEYLNILQNFLRLCTDVKRIEEFKKNFTSEDRGTLIILQIANKFIDLNTFGMPPIMEKGFSENEEAFMSEIKYIREQMKDFITKFNDPSERRKLKKTFSSKRARAPEELRDLYLTINQLIGLIQKNQPNAKEKELLDEAEKQKSIQKFIKIIQTFISCLKEGNYKKWEAYIKKQAGKEQYKPLLSLLDQINDILNEKITEETNASVQQIEKLKLNEGKLKQQISNLKKKNVELEKKNKNLELSQPKQQKQVQSEQSQKRLTEWQLKYNELSERYTKLQKSQEKSLSASKNQKEKEINALKKKIEEKDSQIRQLKESIKGLKDKNLDKSKKQNEKKAYEEQAERQIKQLNRTIQQLRIEIQNKNQLIEQTDQRIKKMEAEAKRNQNQSISKNVSPSDQLKLTNDNLSRRVAELTHRLQITLENLQSRQLQIHNLRTYQISEQKNLSIIQNLKNENEAMNRKINMMKNNIESLNHELNEKKRRIEQLQKQLYDDRKSTRGSFKNQKNVGNSIDLIRQLNSQLEKLKRSGASLQQINKELENAHDRGQDVQVLMSKIEQQNVELKKSMIERDRLIWELQMQINRLKDELSLSNSHIYTLESDLSERDQTIKRFQISIKEKQTLSIKQLQNKKDYIRKLQAMISSNEQNIKYLQQQIQRLKRESEQSNIIQNQMGELKLALEKISKLQLSLSEYQRKYQYERRSWIESQNNWQRIEKEWQIKIVEISNKSQTQKRALKDELTKYSNIDKYINDMQKKHQDERKSWETDRQIWSSEKIRMQKQLQRWIIQIQKWQADKLKLNSDRDQLQIEWKTFITKYQQATTQNSRLLSELTQLNSTITQLRYQIEQMAKNSINADNIVWLLSNITSSFIRIHPKPNFGQNQQTSEQIYRALIEIKERFGQAQEEMFLKMENYVVGFIQYDIGKYRYQLAAKIEELSQLRDRLIQFLNNQIEISKKSLTFQYSYEVKESSTAAKSVYETPAKNFEKGLKITQEIKEIKEKTSHARVLFDQS